MLPSEYISVLSAIASLSEVNLACEVLLENISCRSFYTFGDVEVHVNQARQSIRKEPDWYF